MELSKSQEMAIAHNKGPMMVLAGPGSGKTTVITRRIAELIDTYGVAPEKILVITFTRAAACEMKERFMRLTEGRINSVNFGTFHAVFFRIIKHAYSYDTSNILSEDDKYRAIREIVTSLGIDVQDEKDFVSEISSEIAKLKNSRILPQNFYSTVCAAEDFRRIYAEYSGRLKAEKKLDFDDMVLMCLELLEERSDILRFWQEKYEYILIDEFQDINLLQYETIKLLAHPEDNIFIVGDDDQSIYGFRGAKPQIMLGFEREFRGTRRVILDANYRCGSAIVECSSRLIGFNRQRFSKSLVAGSDRRGTVFRGTYPTVAEQNDFVVHRIMEEVRKGASFSDNAVLYRVNSQPRALVEMLREYNIPYSVSDRVPDLYEHWIAKNIFSYLELAAGSRERRHFLQIGNRPKRYISRDMLRTSEMTFDELERACGDKLYVLREVQRLRHDIEFMSGLDLFSSVRYIRRAIGYNAFLREYAAAHGTPPEELFDILDEIEENAKGFASLDDWKAYIEESREEEAKNREKLRREAEAADAVRLMTYHSAKGLEFKNVFLIDVNETLAPYRKAEQPEDIEEERRMFYVAMTRAEEGLYMLSEEERFGKKLTTSRFLNELWKR